MPSPDDSLRLGLHWLIRVRWLTVAGFLALSAGAEFAMGIHLPWAIFAPGFALMAAGNFVAGKFRVAADRETVIGALLFGDIAILTALLYAAGGAHNPFTLFYFLYVVLVAILLPAWAGWLALAGSAAGFAALFLSPYRLEAAVGNTCCDDMGSHLHGMVVAMTLTGAAITYFVTCLGRSLAEADLLLSSSKEALEEGKRFSSLATLAAGVAHELATPLGTIALASRELEKLAGSKGFPAGCAEDARLIRSEVERCRGVIEKFSGQAMVRGEAESRAVSPQDFPALLLPHLPSPYAVRIAWETGSDQRPVPLPLAGVLRALGILAKNACEASPAASPVRILVRREPGWMTFVISDRGVGLAPEVLGRLGEPFFTQKPDGGGMGLGIFLVKLFCEQSGGSLKFSSRPEKGTEATLRLPIAE